MSGPGLYVAGAASKDAARGLIPEDDQKLILRVEEKTNQRTGRAYHLIFLHSADLALQVLGRLPEEFTTGDTYHREKPYVKLLEERVFDPSRPSDRGSRSGMDSSKWNRGQPIGGGNTSESDNAGGSGGYRQRGGGGYSGRNSKPRAFDRGGGRGRGGRDAGPKRGRFDGGGGGEGATQAE